MCIGVSYIPGPQLEIRPSPLAILANKQVRHTIFAFTDNAMCCLPRLYLDVNPVRETFGQLFTRSPRT